MSTDAQIADAQRALEHATTERARVASDYRDTWTNIVTDLRDAGQNDLADRIENMRRDDDA